MPPLPCRAATTISASKRDGYQVRINKRLEFKPGHWRFWTFWNMNNVEAWALACEFEGLPYDLRGAVMSVTPFARSGRDEIFCSEFMGIIADMHKPHTLTPSDWEANAMRDGAEMTVLTDKDGGAG